MLDLLHKLSLPAYRLDERHSPPSRRIFSPRGSLPPHQEKVKEQERELVKALLGMECFTDIKYSSLKPSFPLRTKMKV